MVQYFFPKFTCFGGDKNNNLGMILGSVEKVVVEKVIKKGPASWLFGSFFTEEQSGPSFSRKKWAVFKKGI